MFIIRNNRPEVSKDHRATVCFAVNASGTWYPRLDGNAFRSTTRLWIKAVDKVAVFLVSAEIPFRFHPHNIVDLDSGNLPCSSNGRGVLQVFEHSNGWCIC